MTTVNGTNVQQITARPLGAIAPQAPAAAPVSAAMSSDSFVRGGGAAVAPTLPGATPAASTIPVAASPTPAAVPATPIARPAVTAPTPPSSAATPAPLLAPVQASDAGSVAGAFRLLAIQARSTSAVPTFTNPELAIAAANQPAANSTNPETALAALTGASPAATPTAAASATNPEAALAALTPGPAVAPNASPDASPGTPSDAPAAATPADPGALPLDPAIAPSVAVPDAPAAAPAPAAPLDYQTNDPAAAVSQPLAQAASDDAAFQIALQSIQAQAASSPADPTPAADPAPAAKPTPAAKPAPAPKPAPKPAPAAKPAAPNASADAASIEKLKKLSPEELAHLGATDKKAFFAALRPAAEEAERQYGVPAAITLAQAALETGWAKNVIPGFNLFGMKGHGTAGTTSQATHEYYGGKYVAVQANFAKFTDFYDAVVAHGKLFHNGYYDKAMNQYAKDHDVFAFARNITGVYATSPAYGASLSGIMRTYNLA